MSRTERKHDLSRLPRLPNVTAGPTVAQSLGGKGKAKRGKSSGPVVSKLAAEFAWLWFHFGDPAFKAEQEYKFDPDRDWRFDVAFPAQKVAVEIDGGVWTGGRHVRGKGFTDDCTKRNAATRGGWAVLNFTSWHLAKKRQTETLDVLLETLRRRL